jgi:hypothetical protein
MSTTHIPIGPTFQFEAGKAQAMSFAVRESGVAMDAGRDLVFRVGPAAGVAVYEQTVTTGTAGIVAFYATPETVGVYEYSLDDPDGPGGIPIPLMRGACSVRAVIGPAA